MTDLRSTMLPPPPETIPAQPAPTEAAVEQLWASVIEESRITWRPGFEPEEEALG